VWDVVTEAAKKDEEANKLREGNRSMVHFKVRVTPHHDPHTTNAHYVVTIAGGRSSSGPTHAGETDTRCDSPLLRD
jgi:hypothetical protein